MPSQSSSPRGDQPDHDRGWRDDGHTVVPTLELEAVGVRIVCPGPSLCKAKFGCTTCDASGYVHVDDEERPCPTCDEECTDPARDDECWLIEALSYDGIADGLVNGEQVDITTGHEIVWRDQGGYQDPQVQWKSKGVESYDDRSARLRAEHLAEAGAHRAA